MTKENLKNKLKKLFALRNLLILAILIVVFVQFIQTQRAFGTFSFLQNHDSSLIQEIGQVKEVYGKIGNDLNEVRNFLRMPKASYGGFEDKEEDAEADPEQNKNALQLALFNYVNYIGNQRVREDKIAAYAAYLSELTKSENFKQFLAGQNLILSKLNDSLSSSSLEISDAKSGSLITYYLSKDDGKFYLKSAISKQEGKYGSFQEFEAGAMGFLQNQKAGLIAQVENLRIKQGEISAAIKSEAVREAVKKSNLKLEDKFIDRDLKMTYAIYNKTDELIGEIILDSKTLEITLVDKNAKSVSLTVTDISTALMPFLEKLDTKTFIEKKADKSLQDLQNTMTDNGFKLLLNQVGLKISEQPRTDGGRVFYDILDSKGGVISSIAIEKATGVVNIVEPAGTNPQNLLYFRAEDKKKTLDIPKQIPNYGNASFSGEDDFNILISGSNSGLVDTMIFAHIDEVKKEIRMISIPRDLFYNGRKINAFAVLYSMPELKKVISDMTGYRLDKYIKIDMYAFIEVFDLIGGVDVHLDDAVIDPTYRVVDNGKEGTLHYEPGDYHLSGVQALRLARSRHTSSDFARAQRQQKILEALQDKARNFGFGDADTIYQIAKTVLSKTETDITLEEALAYYFRYQNYKIVSNNVMSSGNVLYVPPYIAQEECDRLVEAAVVAGQPDPGCQSENHAYTLLPLNDDWNVVKWFFKENFEG